MQTVTTERLSLEPITLEIVEAVLLDQRDRVASLANAVLPAQWPGRALVERAFCASLDRIKADPGARLWGDRLMIAKGDDGTRRLVGSVIFHGRPGDDGIAEIGYGVENAMQGQGYASEAARAMVDWALEQRETRAVRATTMPFHRASIKVLERAGLTCMGTEPHDCLGEVLVFLRQTGERLRASA